MAFCVSEFEKGIHDEEILNMGGKLFYVHSKSKNPIRSFFEVLRLVKKQQYKYVLRTSQRYLSTLDLLAAKIGGADVLIFRANNSSIPKSKLLGILQIFTFFMPRIIPNVKLAPSINSAIFVFGKGQVEKGNVRILKNALNISDYVFDNKKRCEFRQSIGVESDTVVILHIGRLCEQKNQTYTLDIYNEYLKQNLNSMLVFIGEGELKNVVMEKVGQFSIESKVMFLDMRKDISSVMSGADVILLPSLYEGLPNVIIEAQASALPCIVSDAVTNEVNVTGLVSFLSLDDSFLIWAKKINERVNVSARNSSPVIALLMKSGYDIRDTTDYFAKLVFSEK
jgi:glycosyltransferase involved in cell wall biosynthesis